MGRSHLRVFAADGAFLPGGYFVALPRVPASLLAEGFRRAVLDFPVKNEIHSIQPRCEKEVASLSRLE